MRSVLSVNCAQLHIGTGATGLQINARESRVTDNCGCRDFSGLDTLAASRVLRRLRDRGLLDKRGRGSSIHYALPAGPDADAAAAETFGQTRLPLKVPAKVGESPYGDSRNPHMPAPESPHARHVEIPEALRQRIQAAGKKPHQAVVRSLVQALCGLRPFTAAELATVLSGRDAGELKRLHLKPLREAGFLTLPYPESERHPASGLPHRAIRPEGIGQWSLKETRT